MRVRRTKIELYNNEQEIIISKIIDILNIKTNNSTTLYELDNNIDLQDKILELIPDIKKYFKGSVIKSLSYPDKVKRVYLSILKFILKHKYSIFTNDTTITINNSKIRTQKYIFIKNDLL
jgi:hypothetical protein